MNKDNEIMSDGITPVKPSKKRTSVNLDNDLTPKSEKVANRMKELRRGSFSNYVEYLIQEDVKSAELQEAIA